MLAFVPIEGEPISWFSAFRAVLGKDLYVRTKGHINSFTHDDVERMLAIRFVVDERHYLYHFLGQLMDAALCAALTIGPVRRAFWTHSPYHGESTADAPAVDRRPPGRGDLQGRQRRRLGRVPPVAKRAGDVGRGALRGHASARAENDRRLICVRAHTDDVDRRSSRAESDVAQEDFLGTRSAVPAIVRRTRLSPQ